MFIFLELMLFLYMEVLTCLDDIILMASSKLSGLYSASRNSVAKEYSSLRVCGSFAKAQSGPLLMI
jgi:hypothetical protein